ncbi:LptA/OstA family protein [Thermaurantiacus sp.]
MRRPALRALAALAALCAALPLDAQSLATSALRGHDSRLPIDVNADRIEVLEAEKQALFTGNVRVRQGSLALDAQRIRVLYDQPERGRPVIRRLDAEGAVRIASPSERATARYGIYDVENRILTLIGGVELVQGQTRLDGNRLVINLETGRSTLDGRNAAGDGGGRVTGRFAVPERRK